MNPEARLGPSNVRVNPTHGTKKEAPRAVPARAAGPPADEAGLIARCRAGDTTAFRFLVERYRDRACGLAHRILRSETDAEEVAQDAFVKAWLGLKNFRGDASFSTWLYRIVARRSLDRVSMLRARRAREESLEDADGAAAEARVPTHDSRRLARLMETLPEGQRGVIALFYYEEHSVSEIGKILGMPEGTVKTNLARARAALRREWLRRERLEASDEV